MGPILSQPVKEKKSASAESNRIRYATSCMQGWRRSMEDAHMTYPEFQQDTSLFGIFDGHGGKEVAEYAAAHFLQLLQKNKNFKDQKFEQALIDTFLEIDDQLETDDGKKELFQIKGEGKGGSFSASTFRSDAGCTANVVLIYKNDVYVANAGDSRSVLSYKGAQPKELSIDHKPELEKEKERIQKANGFVADNRVNGNLNLSRALGDLEYKSDKTFKKEEQLIIATPDVTKHVITSDDEFILMGCDGIWECKSNQDLMKFINDKIKAKEQQQQQPISPKDLEQILEDLLEDIIAPDIQTGHGLDNMSTILIQFKKQ